MQQTDQSLLNEIFLTPSQQVIADRFSAENANVPANCSGHCASGVCKTG